jgi:hypothetical protein
VGRRGYGRTLIAYELDEPLAALMSSSARHSAMDFTFRNAESRVYIHPCTLATVAGGKGNGRTPIVKSAID